MNTYGFIHSLNKDSFKIKDEAHPSGFIERNRHLIIRVMTVYNFVMNVLGYVPFVSLVSGSCRIGFAVALLTIGLLEGEKTHRKELILTAICQVSKGVLEAFVPFGSLVNLCLDTAFVPINYRKQIKNSVREEACDF